MSRVAYVEDQEGAYIIRDIIYRLRTKLEITNILILHEYGYKFSTGN